MIRAQAFVSIRISSNPSATSSLQVQPVTEGTWGIVGKMNQRFRKGERVKLLEVASSQPLVESMSAR